ncbi:hypothetical protein TI39_contig71g00010 [Zymoseptoria brevis]|uniref:Zn(2)-C6 fungal-type domain-containing protein n=1 Tax=Zymoseptoria brevis TaxID=1047168 RepID=A0A0F4GXT6_9PEZI|nr:hypothetical protein TI39_contig71g00010 [Zymoseptoria brevis]
MDSWMYTSSSTGGHKEDTAPAAGSPRIHLSPHDQPNHARNGAASSEAPKTRIRRRNRVINSCLECRRRKLKCDKQAPCTNCVRFRRDCLYLAPTLDPQSQQKLAEMKERMGDLEQNLEREVAGQAHQKFHPGGVQIKRADSAGSDHHPNNQDQDHDEKGNYDAEEENLEPSPLAELDNVYEDNTDDELMDLGVQLGKMRIGERVGGWIRPKLVEELTQTIDGAVEAKNQAPDLPDYALFSADQEQSPRASKRVVNPRSYIGPGPDYIAPASSFFFPGTNMSANLVNYLPSQHAADKLIAQYWRAVHYMCRTVHRPTFEAQYSLFWGQVLVGSEPAPSVQGVVFAAMFSAAVSMSPEQVSQQFGTTKDMLVDSLRTGTEAALARANFLRTTKVETMQAFVMYLIPLIRGEVSRAHSALVGTAIRLAECMGLHRDGTNYNMTAVEIHVRRMLWYQLCFLDMRTCEATGPRPQIRKDDYDTKLPLNVDDADLLLPHPPTEDKSTWTDMTFSRMRMEYQVLRNQNWWYMFDIDKKKRSLTSVLIKIQKFRIAAEEKFLPMIDGSIPFHRLCRNILEMGCKAMHLQVLHRYLFSTTQRMPDRLRQLLIEAALSQMEVCIVCEKDPEMREWMWYRGAYQQYHGALLLLIEVYAYPMRREAPRIWKCLDWVFELPSQMAPKQKAQLVLTDLRDRMEVYHQTRKVKVSNQLRERLVAPRKNPISSPVGAVLDSAGQMKQMATPPPAAAMLMMPVTPADSSGPSHVGSGGTEDVRMTTMEDIDWAEWEQAFPSNIYTGDLNIPDFNFNDFHGGGGGGSGGSNYNPTAFNTEEFSNMNSLQSTHFVDQLADIQFTPTLIPDMRGRNAYGNYMPLH